LGRFGRYALPAVGILLIAGCRAVAAPSPGVPSLTPNVQVGQGPTRSLAQKPSATDELAPSTAPTATRTQSPTRTYTSTPLPTLTPTNTYSPTPLPTFTPTPTPVPPTANPTLVPTSIGPQSIATSSPTPVPLPTATIPVPTSSPVAPSPSPGTHRFVPVGSPQPDPSHPCGCPKAPAYIVGRIQDAAGNPLPGVRLVCYNEWHRYPVASSKSAGEYDFPVSQAATTWYVLVLDPADQAISAEVPVLFDPGQSCRYLLDWQRVD
jgi:hypothetical protein